MMSLAAGVVVEALARGCVDEDALGGRHRRRGDGVRRGGGGRVVGAHQEDEDAEEEACSGEDYLETEIATNAGCGTHLM